jgi:hypothetical protein
MRTLVLTIFFLLTTLLFYSQKSITTSGGNASGSGTVSYTVGQLVTLINTGNNGSVSQGVQQSIELFTLVNPDFKSLTLKAITYPNPTKDKIVLALSDHNLTDLFYTIFDVNGRLVKKGEVNKENTTIAMQYFATGVYFLKVNQNSKQLKVFKIIKN